MASRLSVDVNLPLFTEQLPLFSPQTAHESSSNGIPQQQQTPSMQERLAVLLKGDLNFHGENRVCPTFYTHGSSGIRGPFSINAAMSMDKYFIA